MTTTYKGATDEIYKAFNSAWAAGTTALVGYVPFIAWPGIDTGTAPDASKFWVRISTQGINSEQGTLSENIVTDGSRRFETFGLIFLQIFAPKRNDADVLALKLAQLAQNIFRNRTENVIFRNSYIRELQPENGAIRKNVIAQFEFDEIY